MDKPFPTIGEIVRGVANAMDTKSISPKKIDEYVGSSWDDYRAYKEILNHTIEAPVKRYAGSDAARLIAGYFDKFINNYVKLVLAVSLEGMERNESIPLLIKHYFSWYGSEFLLLYASYTGIAERELLLWCDHEVSAVGLAFTAIERYSSQWDISRLEKTDQDRVNAWKRGEDLPSIGKINGIVNALIETESEQVDQIRAILLLARSLDFIKRAETGSQLLLAIQVLMVEQKTKTFRSNQDLVSTIEKIAFEFEVKQQKQLPDQDKDRMVEVLEFLLSEPKSEADLDKLKEFTEWVAPYEKSQQFFYLSFQALRAVLIGDLKEGSQFYEELVEYSLYRSGIEQVAAIESCLAVTAAANIGRKRPLLKRLKNQMLVFGLRRPLPVRDQYERDNINKRSRALKDDLVDDWEVESWKVDFQRLFPEELMFPGKKHTNKDRRVGGMFYSDGQLDKQKPDYQEPNKIIRVKDSSGRIKLYPQIVFYTQLLEVEVVDRLLQKGASVDDCSESNETAILFALSAVDLNDNPFIELDRVLFELLSKYPHAKKTMNLRTPKKRLLPILHAIGSGQPDIVEKVIEMGADPNRTGGNMDVSPLYWCLNMIREVRDPERYAVKLIESSLSPSDRDLEIQIRHNPLGSSMHIMGQRNQKAKHIRSNIDGFTDQALAIKSFCEEKSSKIDVQNLIEIVQILLEKGADPNQEQNSSLAALNGFTPQMLAAEHDEPELFEMMLDHGGDYLKTCRSPLDYKDYNSIDIANQWKSKRVVYVLKKRGLLDTKLSEGKN